MKNIFPVEISVPSFRMSKPFNFGRMLSCACQSSYRIRVKTHKSISSDLLFADKNNGKRIPETIEFHELIFRLFENHNA